MNRNPFSAEDLSRSPAHVPASSRVYETLRDQIIALTLAPDTTLSRADLAEAFNVSQSPVREAILRLEQDGLVQSFPQSRTVVTRIDTARILEEHFLRTALESHAARTLAEAPDPQVITKIAGLIRLQEALAGDLDQIEMFSQLDAAFHEALFVGLGQVGLQHLMAARCGNLARLRALDLPRPEKMASVVDGHRAVLEAIEKADPDAAAAAMRRHLSGTMERMEQIVAANPEMFS